MDLHMTPPSYASRKYLNTVELLRTAKYFKSKMNSSSINEMTRMELRKFEESYELLKIKEQVLGYLEDLTKGKIATQPISEHQLRVFSDWVVSDVPRYQWPKDADPRARERLSWLRSAIDNSSDSQKTIQKIVRTIYLESRPDIDVNKVENLVLAGGGAKALSLAGAIKSLDENGVTPSIKRVAGTSGGAIMALAYAAGYTSNEIGDIVKDNNFGLFTLGSRLDIGILNQWANKYQRDDKSQIGHVLSDNSLAHDYHTHLMERLSESILKSSSVKINWIKKELNPKASRKENGKILAGFISNTSNKDAFYDGMLTELGDDELFNIDCKAHKDTWEKAPETWSATETTLYKNPRTAILNAMRHKSGQDIIRGFFSDLVLDKLRKLPPESIRAVFLGEDHRDDKTKFVPLGALREVTFEQWHALHVECGDKIKDLHISICIVKPKLKGLADSIKNKKLSFKEFESVSYKNEEFKSMRVVDAVRVSMNLPPIYPSFKFEVNRKQYLGSDGGELSNFSLSTFDNQYEPESTIGVFYKTEKELGNEVDVSRLLVLPRSESIIRKDIESMQQQLASINKRLQKLKACSEKGAPLQDETVLTDESRKLAGKLSAAEIELQGLVKVSKTETSISDILKMPLSKVGEGVSAYLEKKNRDDLNSHKNLRRLVMINTEDVGTIDFKLTSEDKSKQINFGNAAMGSLLNGNYCLENHFHYHQFNSIVKRFEGDGFVDTEGLDETLAFGMEPSGAADEDENSSPRLYVTKQGEIRTMSYSINGLKGDYRFDKARSVNIDRTKRLKDIVEQRSKVSWKHH